MNPHLELIQRAIDSIGDRDILSELNRVRRARHTGLELASDLRSSVSLEKATLHRKKVPVLRLHDRTLYPRSYDYSIEGGNASSMRQEMEEILHHCIRVGETLEELGFIQRGVLSYSYGKLELLIEGDSTELHSQSYWTQPRDPDFLHHHIRALYDDSYAGRRTVKYDSTLFDEIRELLRSCFSLEMLASLDRRLVDWMVGV